MSLALALTIGVSVALLTYLVFAANSRSRLQTRLAASSGALVDSLRSLRSVKLGGTKKSKAQTRVLLELPDQLDFLAVAVSAGESIYAAISLLVPRATGQFADGLARVLKRVELGETLVDSLDQLAVELPQPQVAEFCSKVSLALRRGTPLAQLLRDQAETVRSEIKNQLLRAAGKNETRMLIPLIFLILPVTVLFATYPSLQLLQLTL